MRYLKLHFVTIEQRGHEAQRGIALLDFPQRLLAQLVVGAPAEVGIDAHSIARLSA
jgi:hypothetical protein